MTDDLNRFDDAGMTPLLIAVFRGDAERVRELLIAGADPNLCVNGESPLWYAEDDFGLEEVAAILRQFGAKK